MQGKGQFSSIHQKQPPYSSTSSSSSSSSFPAFSNSHGRQSHQTPQSHATAMVLNVAEFEGSCGTTRAWFSVLCPYSVVVTTFFKRFPETMRKYKDSTRVWVFSFEIYEDFVSLAQSKEYEGKFNVIELPRFLVHGINTFIGKLKKRPPEEFDEINLEENLLEILLPHQLEGIRFAISRCGRALIGDEMGCGKTIQAIGLLQHYRKHFPALLLMPPTLVDQWVDELLKYCGGFLSASDIHCVKKSSDNVYGRVCIIPYTILDGLIDKGKLKPHMFGIVIADESHSLKNKEAKRSCVAIPLLKFAEIAICLTGTPATNRPVELYSQLSGLLPYVFDDYDAFTRRYCDAKPHRFRSGMDVTGCSNSMELKLVLEGLVMIRRLKADVLNTLPAKQRVLEYVTASQRYMQQIQALDKKAQALDKRINSKNIDLSEIAKLKAEKQVIDTAHYVLVGMSKIDAVKQEITKLMNEEKESREREAATAKEERSDIVIDMATAAAAEVVVIDMDSSVSTLQNEFDIAERNKYDDTVCQQQLLHLNSSSSKTDAAPIIMQLEDDGILGFAVKGFAESATGCASFGPAVVDLSDETNIVDTDSEDDSKRIPCRGSGKKNILRKKMSGIEVNEEGNTKRHSDLEITISQRNTEKRKRDNDQNDVWEDDSMDDLFSLHVPLKSRLRSKQESIGSTQQKGNVKGRASAASSLAAAPLAPVFTSPFTKTAKADDRTPKSCSSSGKKKRYQNVSKLGKKIIIFAHHEEVMNAIQEFLYHEDIHHIRIDGKVSTVNRQPLIEKFQEDNVTDIALLSITACGTGINLTRANVALFAELHWSPGPILQAEDRIHRIGQKSSSVRVIYLVVRDSIDETIWNQLQRKHNVLNATVGIADNTGSGMAINCRMNSKDPLQRTLHDFIPNSQVHSSSMASTASYAEPVVALPIPKAADVYGPLIQADKSAAFSGSAQDSHLSIPFAYELSQSSVDSRSSSENMKSFATISDNYQYTNKSCAGFVDASVVYGSCKGSHLNENETAAPLIAGLNPSGHNVQTRVPSIHEQYGGIMSKYSQQSDQKRAANSVQQPALGQTPTAADVYGRQAIDGSADNNPRSGSVKQGSSSYADTRVVGDGNCAVANQQSKAPPVSEAQLLLDAGRLRLEANRRLAQEKAAARKQQLMSATFSATTAACPIPGKDISLNAGPSPFNSTTASNIHNFEFKSALGSTVSVVVDPARNVGDVGGSIGMSGGLNGSNYRDVSNSRSVD